MSDTLESIKRLRAELRERLEKIPEFREYEVLGKTIADLESIGRVGVTTSASSVVTGKSFLLNAGESEKRLPTLSEMLTDQLVAHLKAQQPSNADLCIARIKEVGAPQTTGELTSYLEGQNRPAKSLVSSLSRDDRLINIPWGGNKAWWINGAALPQEPDGLLGIGRQTEGEASAADVEELLK